MRAGRIAVVLAAVVAAAQVRAEGPDASNRPSVPAGAGRSAGMETPLPARVMVSGRLVSVDARGGTIDVFRDQKVLKLELDRDALVTQAGKTMALADLQPGQSVVVQLQLVGRTARANWVAAKPMAAPSEAALAETAPAPPPAPPPALAAAQGPATR